MNNFDTDIPEIIMNTDICDIISCPYFKWTDEDKRKIKAFTSKLKTKTVKQMSEYERELVKFLFVSYFRWFDAKKRAIAYCVILGGVSASQIGKMVLFDFGDKNPRAEDRISRATSVYSLCSMAEADDKSKTSILDLNFHRAIMLNGNYWWFNNVLFNETMIDYIQNVRGIIPGALFTQDRRAKGKKDEAPPPISTATVGRIIRQAAEDLGFGGVGQKIQFHRLAFS